MSEENQVEEVTTPPDEAVFLDQNSEQTQPDQVEDQGGAQAEGQPQRDFESEAREMGWVPEEEFKGEKKPYKFLSAQEFVERGETVLPLVRNENKRLREQMDAKEREFEERIERLSKASEASLKAQRKQFEDRIAALNVERDRAVEEGDVERFKTLDKQIKDAEANTPKIENDPVVSEDPAKVEQDWLSKNSWYHDDEEMQRYALWYSHKIKDPKMPLSENLKRTEEAVKQQFPMKFGGKPAGANGHAPVEGGGVPKPAKTSKTPNFDKLPAEAKEMAERDVKAGLYKNKEDWAKVYNQ